jgi:N6-adenosine-specific RNA methylase IME4
MVTASDDLIRWAGGKKFTTILADPPWRFQNSTGKVAPEHKRLSRYGTMSLREIMELPVSHIVHETAHLYLWVPNALLPDGLAVMEAWGFTYKSNLVWHKVRKDGGSDGRGVGFYFRNVTELVLFGVRGKHARTLDPGRRQVNYLATRKREHSRKPDELYPIIEACSPWPYVELFARGPRKNWKCWGDESESYAPTWKTYANHSQADKQTAVAVSKPKKRNAAEKPILAPAMFIEKALLAAHGQTVSASAAYAAYEAQCAAQNCKPVAAISFWQTFSARARKLGATKKTQDGRVVYADIKLAA